MVTGAIMCPMFVFATRSAKPWKYREFSLCTPNVLHVTGLIYVAIIALWAAVLIPIWLRRHDQISEVRSTARFSSAMKSLGSTENIAYRDRQHGENHMSQAHRNSGPKNYGHRINSPKSQKSQASMVATKRRTMVLATLTALLLLSLVGTFTALVPLAVTVVVAVVLGAFFIASALTSSQRSKVAVSPRVSRAEAFASAEFEAEVEVVEVPARRMSSRERAESQKSELDEFAEWDPWGDEDADRSWDAVSETLPSYVNSPRATAIPRNIERNGDWSGQAMVETARGMRRPAMRSADLIRNPAANAADDTTEIPIIRANVPYQPRAVNE